MSQNLALSEIFQSSFSNQTKSRGASYFRTGEVSELDVENGSIFAIVNGYNAFLDLDDSTSEDSVHCDCPHFEDGNYCKHLWATMLAYEASPPVANTSRKQEKQNKPPAAWHSLLTKASNANERTRSDSTSGFKDVPVKESQILWVIDCGGQFAHDEELVLSVMRRVRKKNGEWGKANAIRLDHEVADALTEAIDRRIAYALLGAENASSHGYGYGSYIEGSKNFELGPNVLAELCEALVASNRFYWTLDDRFEFEDLNLIKACDFETPTYVSVNIERVPKSKAKSRMSVGIEKGDALIDDSQVVMMTNKGVCLLTTGLIKIRNPQAVDLWKLAHESPAIEIKDSERDEFLKQLAATPGLPSVRFPANWSVEQVNEIPAQGILTLGEDGRTFNHLVGNLFFGYGENKVAFSSSQATFFDPETQQWGQRHTEAEAELLKALLGFPITDTTVNRFVDYDFSIHRKHLIRLVDELGTQGWRIELYGKSIKQAGNFDIQVQSGQDWFDLSAEVQFGGESIPLPSLLQAISKKESFVTLSDGSQGRLPSELAEKYARFAKFGEVHGDSIRFRPSQAMLLDAMLESQPHVRMDAGFQKIRKKLKSFSGIKPKAAPKSFNGDLRAYQKEGLGWLHFLRDFGLGGCLADDMGLGKTIQVLALLESRRTRRVEKQAPENQAMEHDADKIANNKTEPAAIAVAAAQSKRKPSIVIVPKSLIFNWMEEATKFTPRLRFFNYTGTDRRARAADSEGFDVLITTYGTMRKDIGDLSSIEFDYAILDESQAIKNSKALCAKSSRLLRADHRLAMTGTPIENHLGELWSLFEFLNPGMLGGTTHFASLTKQKKGDEAERAETLKTLSKALQPFLLRRTKTQVLTDLPPKTEQTLHCDMLPAQKTKYNELKEYYRIKLAKRIETDGLGRSKIQVLEALLRLRQVACDPRLLDKSAKPGAKLELLEQQLSEIVSEGHKVLVFSQFTSLLGLVKDQFDQAGITYEYLDGKTSKRAEKVKRFQTDPAVSAFLISIKAGGQGLNLTAADYVFLLDPWWNPAVEAQAIDRAHRMGQQNPVIAYRMICNDTVEEKIVSLQASKRELADSVINADESLIRSMTAEDLQLILR